MKNGRKHEIEVFICAAHEAFIFEDIVQNGGEEYYDYGISASTDESEDENFGMASSDIDWKVGFMPSALKSEYAALFEYDVETCKPASAKDRRLTRLIGRCVLHSGSLFITNSLLCCFFYFAKLLQTTIPMILALSTTPPSLPMSLPLSLLLSLLVLSHVVSITFMEMLSYIYEFLCALSQYS